jgi:hypothetical protein
MLIGRPRTNGNAQTQHPAPGAVNQPVAAVHRRYINAIACALKVSRALKSSA